MLKYLRIHRIALALALLGLIAPTSAVAAQRYAAPGGVTSGSCPQAAPCRIDRAVNLAEAGDEVLVAPGDYDVTATPLSTSQGLTVRAADSSSPPYLTSDSASSSTLVLGDQSAVRDLILEYTGGDARHALAVGMGTRIERVFASSNGTSAIFGRSLFVSDTAAFASGVSGSALYAYGYGETIVSNATLIGTGPNSFGLALRAPSSSLALGYVQNTIARGEGSDLSVSTDGAGSQSQLHVDYSNFRPDNTSTFGPGINTYDLGSHNQDGNAVAPLFEGTSALDVHQLSSSPTVDAGTVAPSMGSLDIDGDPRILGAAPDIGADELVPSVVARSPEPPPPGTPPSLTGLTKTNAVFWPRYRLTEPPPKVPRHTTFSFFLNQNAGVNVVFKRIVKGRLVQRGQLTHAGVTGKNRLLFSGRVPTKSRPRKLLPPGRYKAFFTASNEFGSSPTSVVGFRIAKPPQL